MRGNGSWVWFAVVAMVQAILAQAGCQSAAPPSPAPSGDGAVYAIGLTAQTPASLGKCTTALQGQVAYVLSPPSLWKCEAGAWSQIACTAAKAGDVAYSSTTMLLVACINNTWTAVNLPPGPQGDAGPPGPEGPQGEAGPQGPMGATGDSGPPGATTLVTLSPFTGAAGPCMNGGTRIDAGVDLNGDGILEPTEITTTAYVCSGAPGSTGPAGEAGSEGPQGEAGAPGARSLISLSTAPASQCPYGGTEVQVGIDKNGDGILEPSEVQQTAYVCNGSPTPPCAPGTTQCSGDTVQTCGANGQWTSGPACAGATPACLDGACVQCAPASVRCSAEQPQTCNAAGAWQSIGPSCDKIQVDGAAGSCCSGACVQKADDPNHCGGCGIQCPTTDPNAASDSCTAGVCVLACKPGFALCNKKCTSYQSCVPFFAFAAPVEYYDYYGATGGSAVVIRDFNKDGKPDVVVGNGNSNGSGQGVISFQGNGDGTLQAGNESAGYTTWGGIAAADFNGDGYSDVALTGQQGYSSVDIELANPGGFASEAFGNGVYANYYYFASPTGVPTDVATADFNGDGIADLAVANDAQGNSTIGILLGKGDGTFLPYVDYAAGNATWSLVTGDFNGDGATDLAVTNQGSNDVSILAGNGDGTFRAPVNFAVGPQPRAIATGDFNGDGRTDLVVANLDTAHVSSQYPPLPGSLSVLLGNGDGTFQDAIGVPTEGGPTGLAVADFDGDGMEDIAVTTGDSGLNTVDILLGNGNGSFQPYEVFVAGPTWVNGGVGVYPYGVAAGDLNGDGRPDLTIGDYESTGGVIVLLNASAPCAVTRAYASHTSAPVGGTITLQAQGALSSGGPANLDYSWAVTGGPGSGTFSDPNAPSPAFTCTSPGLVTVTATASEGGGGPSCVDKKAVQFECGNCTNDLSNIGTGDFFISITINTVAATPNAEAGILNQRSACTDGMFWDLRYRADGTVDMQTDDGTGAANFTDLTTTAKVNDGNPHQIIVERMSGMLTISVDGVSTPAVASKASFGALPPVTQGSDVCDFNYFIAGVSPPVCITSLQ